MSASLRWKPVPALGRIGARSPEYQSSAPPSARPECAARVHEAPQKSAQPSRSDQARQAGYHNGHKVGYEERLKAGLQKGYQAGIKEGGLPQAREAISSNAVVDI